MPSQKGWDLTKLTGAQGNRSMCTGQHSLAHGRICALQSVICTQHSLRWQGSPGLHGKAVHTSGLSDTSFSLLLHPQSIPEVWSPLQTGALVSHALHSTGWKQFHNYLDIHLSNKWSDFEESCLTEIRFSRYYKPSTELI